MTFLFNGRASLTSSEEVEGFMGRMTSVRSHLCGQQGKKKDIFSFFFLRIN